MKRICALLLIASVLQLAACGQQPTNSSSGQNTQPVPSPDQQTETPAQQHDEPTPQPESPAHVKKDIDYYLSFDEEYDGIWDDLELTVDGETAELYEPDLVDATVGFTIVFETAAHENPVSITYFLGYLDYSVRYYNYPAIAEIQDYDTYYSETEGDWDGNALYTKEHITYYENGQVQSRIVQGVKEDAETSDQTVYVVSEEYYDEDGNETAKPE